MTMAIRTGAIAGLADQIPAGVRYLSLDCFDTLVWRNCAAPADVFADLPMAGGAIPVRRSAETLARNARRIADGGTEATLDQIHRALRPGDDTARSIAEELAAEHRHCFGFRPTMELIAAAKARGLQVIIVSDTYLTEIELRALIARACGADTADAIDRIFPSSAYGVGKAAGLFEHVLRELGCAPTALFHLGDNRVADQDAPEELGIPCAHLVQFDHQAETRLRLEGAASAMIDPRVRVSLPAYQPHRALVSLRADDDAAHGLGHDVLGPVLTGYCRWLADEATAIAARDGRPAHLLFLLRDGYLPAQVHEKLFPDAAAASVEISRFTATAASFVDRDAVRAWLNAQLDTSRNDVIVRQLLHDDAETRKLAPRQAITDRDFLASLSTDVVCDRVVARSRRFADRLIAHLKRAGVQPGDSVILADLGYNGSVQNQLAPMLEARMNLKVAGRYLLLREKVPTGLDKQGWFDARHYDHQVLNALCDSMAVIEQLCTVDQGSVVDYKPNGFPVRKARDGGKNQIAGRNVVQAGCVAYAERLAGWTGPVAASDTPEAQRVAAAAALARLLFFPTPAEVAALSSFEHDVNLGTAERVELLDPDAAAAGLRRGGLFYLDESMRVFLPGELRRSGVALNLALFATRRFGLELTGGDIQGEPITVPVMLADERGQVIVDIPAYPTQDGFYAANIPVGTGKMAGIQWGRAYDWLQIEDARFYPVKYFGDISRRGPGTPAQMVHDGLENPAGDLFRCAAETAFTLVPPPANRDGGNLVLTVAFRPIAGRKSEVARLAA